MNRVLLSAVLAAAAMSCGLPIEKCADKTFGGPFCIPDSGVAAPGRTLTFQIVDQCSGGCGKHSLACEVRRDGGTITLTVAGQVCDPPPNVACALACALTPMSCTLPALEEGDYTLLSPGFGTQTLQVRDGGTGDCKATPF